MIDLNALRVLITTFICIAFVGQVPMSFGQVIFYVTCLIGQMREEVNVGPCPPFHTHTNTVIHLNVQYIYNLVSTCGWHSCYLTGIIPSIWCSHFSAMDTMYSIYTVKKQSPLLISTRGICAYIMDAPWMHIDYMIYVHIYNTYTDAP